MHDTLRHERSEADREKHFVALSSVVAALALTGMKLGVGLWTNSLGILSEAMHSGLDLLAAGMTLWAVRVSSKPADRDHPYGHGKFENLSALFETGLLLITCVWIIYEAGRRLFFVAEIDVDPSVWAFAVVIVSIVVDISRSRALSRVAKKYESQALEADALHFSTDVYSSLVVLLGLCGVLVGEMFDWPWMIKADALAALGVAAIVVVVSMQLGKKAFDDLSDAAPVALRAEVVRVAATTPGVERVTQTRLRRSGPGYFVDVTVGVERTVAFERAHEISEEVETRIRAVLSSADVVVHVEPIASESEDLPQMIALMAVRGSLAAHSVRVYREPGGRAIEMHVEVDRGLNLEQAHRKVSEFEAGLRRAVPDLQRIVTHIEPAGAAEAVDSQPADEASVRKTIDEFLQSRPGLDGVHRLEVKVIDGELSVSLHLTLDPSTPITTAHELTGQFEQFLRRNVPRLRRVVIHVEPRKA